MVVRKNGKNLTTVYRKPTLSGQYVQRNSFCHDSRKVHVTKILILRALRICSPSLLELKLDFIKSVFLENRYPLEVIQTSIKGYTTTTKERTSVWTREVPSLPKATGH